jgi:hypothetical protein
MSNSIQDLQKKKQDCIDIELGIQCAGNCEGKKIC